MSVPPEKLHELLTYCMDFAKTMLNDSGDFYPFGAVLGKKIARSKQLVVTMATSVPILKIYIACWGKALLGAPRTDQFLRWPLQQM